MCYSLSTHGYVCRTCQNEHTVSWLTLAVKLPELRISTPGALEIIVLTFTPGRRAIRESTWVAHTRYRSYTTENRRDVFFGACTRTAVASDDTHDLEDRKSIRGGLNTSDLLPIEPLQTAGARGAQYPEQDRSLFLGYEDIVCVFSLQCCMSG